MHTHIRFNAILAGMKLMAVIFMLQQSDSSDVKSAKRTLYHPNMISKWNNLVNNCDSFYESSQFNWLETFIRKAQPALAMR